MAARIFTFGIVFLILSGFFWVFGASMDVLPQAIRSGSLALFSFQRPSYILEKDDLSKEVYVCDPDRDTCKVNFDFRSTFSEAFPERDAECFVDFGLTDLSGQENRCNPNTIEFPFGEHLVDVRIEHEDDPAIFYTREIRIHRASLASLSSLISFDPPKAKILLQGTLSKHKRRVGDTLYCHTSTTCSVNFDGRESEGEKLSYRWEYPEMIIEKANPNSVRLKHGNHTIKLYVTDVFGATSKAAFDVIVLPHGVDDLDEPVEAVITLQGKLSKDKALDDNRLTCYTDDTCSINFTGEESSGPIDSYHWDLGYGLTSEKENPPQYRLPIGEYEIRLRITDLDGREDEDVFYVLVQPHPIEKQEEEEDVIEPEEGVPEVVAEKEKTNYYVRVTHRKDTSIRVGGRHRAQGTVNITITSPDDHVKNEELDTDGEGLFEHIFIPNQTGEYGISIQAEGLQKEKKVVVDGLLPNFTESLDVRIHVQGKMSKNRWLRGDVFTCLSRSGCSVNLTADTGGRKHLSYRWEYTTGERFNKENPTAVKMPFGKHWVTLNVVDKLTGEHQTLSMEIGSYKLLGSSSKKKGPKAKKVKLQTRDIGGGHVPDESRRWMHLVMQLGIVATSLIGLVHKIRRT